MHVHGNQFDPGIQMNYLASVAKAEAAREAERTRKKLLNAASSLAGDIDEADFVVSLGGEEDSGEQSRKQDQERNQQPDRPQSAPAPEQNFSDYA
jgi:hypothetical protein